MKKVICSFGTIALIAGLVSDAEALENRKILRVGTGWNDGGAAPAKTVYSEVLKTTMTQHPRTGLWGAQTTPEQQEEAKDLGGFNGTQSQVDALTRQNSVLKEQLQALRQQLESYGKELKRIATFCDQVQAFIK